MIIETQADLTRAVLAELGRASDPRFREIMQSAVQHLHDDGPPRHGHRLAGEPAGAA